MQIFIAITITGTPLINIIRTCRLDDKCGMRVKRMWFDAIVTYYVVFIDIRRRRFQSEEAVKLLTT